MSGYLFCPPEKADPEELAGEINLVSKNVIMSGLLQLVGGVLAVLNKHRQVLALNDSFLQILGINDPHEKLGPQAGRDSARFLQNCGPFSPTIPQHVTRIWILPIFIQAPP